MTDPYTIGQDELAERIGVERACAIKRELTRLGVRYFVSRGRVWTTRAALDAALGVGPPQDQPRRIQIG